MFLGHLDLIFSELSTCVLCLNFPLDWMPFSSHCVRVRCQTEMPHSNSASIKDSLSGYKVCGSLIGFRCPVTQGPPASDPWSCSWGSPLPMNEWGIDSWEQVLLFFGQSPANRPWPYSQWQNSSNRQSLLQSWDFC